MDTETQLTRAGDLLHKVWEMETPNMTAKFQVGVSSYLINWNGGGGGNQDLELAF